MLVENEKQYCWLLDEEAGIPQDSIESAIDDYINDHNGFDYECNKCGVNVFTDEVEIGHPCYYVPEIDGEYILERVRDYVPDEIYDRDEDYLFNVKSEHIDELSEELTKVFQAWEKRHGYENRAFVIQETKTYKIIDYI